MHFQDFQGLRLVTGCSSAAAGSVAACLTAQTSQNWQTPGRRFQKAGLLQGLAVSAGVHRLGSRLGFKAASRLSALAEPVAGPFPLPLPFPLPAALPPLLPLPSLPAPPFPPLDPFETTPGSRFQERANADEPKDNAAQDAHVIMMIMCHDKIVPKCHDACKDSRLFKGFAVLASMAKGERRRGGVGPTPGRPQQPNRSILWRLLLSSVQGPQGRPTRPQVKL